MAFAFVQGPAPVAGTGTTVAITVSATVAGNLVTVRIRSATTEVATSVTDNVGNTYVLSSAVDMSTFRTYMAYGVQVTGGATTITVTWAASGVSKSVAADEWSGGAASNAAIFDTSASATGTGTAIAVTLSPAASGELIVGAINRGTGTGNITAGTDYTIPAADVGRLVCRQYRLSGTTSETAPATIYTSLAWCEIAMAFKPASGGAPVNSGFFRFM